MLDAAIEQIKARLPIVEMIGRSVPLRRSGSRWVAPCPFHQEREPSFTVSENGSFHCFGCQASGDIIDFHSRFHGVSFWQSLETLAAEAGVRLAERDPVKEAKLRRQRERRLEYGKINEAAADWFAGQRTRDDAVRYVAERGLTEETVRTFRLGWAGETWQGLCDALAGQGLDTAAAIELGLLREKNGRIYDRFRGRLIFPIADVSGQIVAFGGRRLTGDTAKYINSPDSPFYRKGEHLYGLHQARRAISATRCVILTEGYMDVLSLHQYGFENAVGVLGTALTDEQTERLLGFASRVTLIFDSDAAGRRAAFRACERLLVRGMSCQVVRLPEGEDVDSFLRRHGSDGLGTCMAAAVDGLAYCLESMRDASPLESVQWARKFLSSIRIPELLPAALRRISQGLEIGEDALRRNLGLPETGPRILCSVQSSGQGSERNAENRATRMREEQILMFVTRYPHRHGEICALCGDILLESDFARGFFNKIGQYGEQCEGNLAEGERLLWQRWRTDMPLAAGDGEAEMRAVSSRIDKYFASVYRSALLAALNHAGEGDGELRGILLDNLAALQRKEAGLPV